MRLNKLPPEIVKALPPPRPDDLSPQLLERLSPADAQKVLSRAKAFGPKFECG